ncbi:MAG: response regulator [Bacteroidota bacterium]|nr:response regulator [Bacteroidota bacterium]
MKRKAIVCVDDEPMILSSLIEQLQKLFGDQYQYETAENAEEGMELLEELSGEGTEVMAIVSDWLMPGVKGDEFLIRVHKKYPEIVKVLLTGQANQDSIKNALENADLHACIYKPWTENDLRLIISSGLGKK